MVRMYNYRGLLLRWGWTLAVACLVVAAGPSGTTRPRWWKWTMPRKQEDTQRRWDRLVRKRPRGDYGGCNGAGGMVHCLDGKENEAAILQKRLRMIQATSMCMRIGRGGHGHGHGQHEQLLRVPCTILINYEAAQHDDVDMYDYEHEEDYHDSGVLLFVENDANGQDYNFPTSDRFSRRKKHNVVGAYVDTGAQVTVMSYSAVRRLGGAKLCRHIDTRHAGRAIGVGSARVVGRLPKGLLTLRVPIKSPGSDHSEVAYEYERRFGTSSGRRSREVYARLTLPAIHVLERTGTHTTATHEEDEWDVEDDDDEVDLLLGLDVLNECHATICLRDSTLYLRAAADSSSSPKTDVSSPSSSYDVEENDICIPLIRGHRDMHEEEPIKAATIMPSSLLRKKYTTTRSKEAYDEEDEHLGYDDQDSYAHDLLDRHQSSSGGEGGGHGVDTYDSDIYQNPYDSHQEDDAEDVSLCEEDSLQDPHSHDDPHYKLDEEDGKIDSDMHGRDHWSPSSFDQNAEDQQDPTEFRRNRKHKNKKKESFNNHEYHDGRDTTLTGEGLRKRLGRQPRGGAKKVTDKGRWWGSSSRGGGGDIHVNSFYGSSVQQSRQSSRKHTFGGDGVHARIQNEGYGLSPTAISDYGRSEKKGGEMNLFDTNSIVNNNGKEEEDDDEDEEEDSWLEEGMDLSGL